MFYSVLIKMSIYPDVILIRFNPGRVKKYIKALAHSMYSVNVIY